MFYAHICNAAEGIDGYFEFVDRVSLGRFLKWTKSFHVRTSAGQWADYCTVVLDEPATSIHGQEMPKNIVPFVVEDELDSENWVFVFDDNDVYSANTYLEELMEGFLRLNPSDN